MKRDRFLILLVFVATVVLTVQCGKSPPLSTPTPNTSVLAPLQVSTSPIDGPALYDERRAITGQKLQVSASPIDGPALVIQGPPFSIAEPLVAGDKEVLGVGPAQVGVLVVDVTLMGEVLGRGQIGEDGQFSIPVQPPLIVNHRIGLMLDGQAPGIVQTQQSLDQLEQFSGDSAITIPRVGRIYDAASVQP